MRPLGDGPQSRPHHQSIEVAFVNLIERGRAAGHERGSEARDEERRQVHRFRRGHVIAAGGRRDDERIQADLRQQDEIVDLRVRARQREIRHLVTLQGC
jgi:hypothetical protein